MSTSKLLKIIAFVFIYSINLLLALALWLAGLDGNIMIGILLICLYRPSLWLSPIAVTLVCWLPSNPKLPASKTLIFNLVHLGFCGILSLICFLLFGSWF